MFNLIPPSDRTQVKRYFLCGLVHAQNSLHTLYTAVVVEGSTDLCTQGEMAMTTAAEQSNTCSCRDLCPTDLWRQHTCALICEPRSMFMILILFTVSKSQFLGVEEWSTGSLGDLQHPTMPSRFCGVLTPVLASLCPCHS